MADNKINIPYQISGIDRLVGLAIVVALILASMATVRHFRETAPLDEVIHYHTLLKRAYGIAQGADIRLAGISIGKVGDVVLERTGKVRLEIRIERKYREFVTRGSHLEIASTMGLAAIVDLTKLNFVSNPETDELLSPGALIKVAEPMDLADALNSNEIAKMAENIKTILASSAELSAAMARNQELISSSLQNVNRVTVEVQEAVRSLPAIVDSATMGFAAWEMAGTNLYEIINQAEDDVHRIADNAIQATGKMDHALGELSRLVTQLNQIMSRMHESADQVPNLVSDAHALIESANRLTDKLNRHWLFGSETPSDTPRYLPSIHPIPTPSLEPPPGNSNP